MATPTFNCAAVLRGHDGWVTTVAAFEKQGDMLLSGSRDKSVMLWKLSRDTGSLVGMPYRSLRGHSHYVQDIVLSSDGQFALSASWDGTLRLWDLATGTTTRRFVSHSKDVMAVAFSVDNRQILSASRDHTVKLWNTLGECKLTTLNGAHGDWASCVRFSPSVQQPVVVSCGWDKIVKVWEITATEFKLKSDLKGHTAFVNSVTVSPDGSLCASGGKDAQAILWDLKDAKDLYKLDAKSPINALCFSPNRYWLGAATEAGVKVWDLEAKTLLCDLNKSAPGFDLTRGYKDAAALSLAWSADGTTLYAGYSDNTIRVWELQ